MFLVIFSEKQIKKKGPLILDPADMFWTAGVMVTWDLIETSSVARPFLLSGA